MEACSWKTFCPDASFPHSRDQADCLRGLTPVQRTPGTRLNRQNGGALCGAEWGRRREPLSKPDETCWLGVVLVVPLDLLHVGLWRWGPVVSALARKAPIGAWPESPGWPSLQPPFVRPLLVSAVELTDQDRA